MKKAILPGFRFYGNGRMAFISVIEQKFGFSEFIAEE
jgi:hypothetical protein